MFVHLGSGTGNQAAKEGDLGRYEATLERLGPERQSESTLASMEARENNTACMGALNRACLGDQIGP